MKVKLISYSKPTEEVNSEGIDDVQELVAFCARVSNPSNQLNTETSEKLISYLIKNAHWSPLEMVSACLEIETTRDIARQMLRHRSFSFQEFSQRYANPVKDLEFVIREARMQDLKNRQNSIDDLPSETAEYYEDRIDKHFREGVELYESLLHSGVAKECARSVLPINTVTRLYMSGTIRSWLHYVDLRGDNGTQREHMSIARSVGEILDTQLPNVARAMWG